MCKDRRRIDPQSPKVKHYQTGIAETVPAHVQYAVRHWGVGTCQAGVIRNSTSGLLHPLLRQLLNLAWKYEICWANWVVGSPHCIGMQGSQGSESPPCTRPVNKCTTMLAGYRAGRLSSRKLIALLGGLRSSDTRVVPSRSAWHACRFTTI